MKGLGIHVNIPRNEYRIGQYVGTKVREMIDEAKFIVANIGPNPNVNFEIGYAEGKQKIIVHCRDLRETRQPPMDIVYTENVEFEDANELTLQLYWGLVSKVSEHA
jgi:hypothetical protein